MWDMGTALGLWELVPSMGFYSTLERADHIDLRAVGQELHCPYNYVKC